MYEKWRMGGFRHAMGMSLCGSVFMLGRGGVTSVRRHRERADLLMPKHIPQQDQGVTVLRCITCVPQEPPHSESRQSGARTSRSRANGPQTGTPMRLSLQLSAPPPSFAAEAVLKTAAILGKDLIAVFQKGGMHPLPFCGPRGADAWPDFGTKGSYT